MSLADAPVPSPVAAPPSAGPVPVPRPQVTPAVPAGARPAPRADGLSENTGRLAAVTFGIAWILCPAVEPMPAGPMPDYPLWQLPIDLAAVVSIVSAVVVLWRGGRNGPRLGVVAGALMAVLTILCPLAGHSAVGWWTWMQTALSLLVLGTSVALMGRTGRHAAGAPTPH